jgi:hypothetical protein
VKLRRPKTIIAVVLGIAIVAWVIVPSRDNGPYYQGKSLFTWLLIEDRLITGQGDITQAQQAVRAIGTNAVPYLVRWIGEETPAWRISLYSSTRARLRFHPTLLRMIVGREWLQARAADVGFALLGTNAAGAIPELEARMRNSKAMVPAARALGALARIGPPAMPALTNALAEPNHPQRAMVVRRLTTLVVEDGPETRDHYLPIFNQLRTDADPGVRVAAENAIRRIALAPRPNAPPN